LSLTLIFLQDAESLLITLLLLGYLKEEYVSTSYTINVYLVPGSQAFRLSRLSFDDIKGNTGPRVNTSFLKETRRKRATTTKDKQSGKIGDYVPPERPRKSSASTSKGKGAAGIQSDDDSEALESRITGRLVHKPSQETTQKRVSEMPKQRGSSFPLKRKRVMSSEEEDCREEIRMTTARDLSGIVGGGVDITRNLHDKQMEPDTDDEWETWSFSFAAGASGTGQASESSRDARKRPRTSSNSKVFDSEEIIELSD
jgi:ATP-dependent DNA helicase Q1